MSSHSLDSICGFVQGLLLSRFNNPVPIAEFHKEIWSLCLSGATRIALAAPRSHAKSTAVTHSLTLYLFLFRLKKYGIIVSDTESQASQFLGDIKTELMENVPLRELFGVKKIVKDAITDIVVEFDNGDQFRIQALGAEQKIRGRKWRHTRPDFIICDDLENAEAVESDERRDKFRSWFMKDLEPSVSRDGIIVVVGTILHLDSILMRLMNNESWTRRLYKAHDGFDDFQGLLWPQQWDEAGLKIIRQRYIDDGYAEGYSQEFLNDPLANTETYFRKEDFKEIEDDMRSLPTRKYAAMDLAISDKDKSAYTVIVVGEMDEYRRLFITQVVRFRGDSNDIINSMFEVQKLYNIDHWKVEKGQIALTLIGELQNRMNQDGVYLNISYGVPTKDKRSRARGIQARMRAGGVYFDTSANWYPDFEQELLHFPKGKYKDQVDALAWLGIMIAEMNEGPTEVEVEEDEYQERLFEFGEVPTGRSSLTGY